MFDFSIYKTEQKELKAQEIFVVGTVSVILTAIIIYFLYAYFRIEYEKEKFRKLIEQESPMVTAARAKQLKDLSSYQVTDKDAQRISIPIEDAITKVAADLSKN